MTRSAAGTFCGARGLRCANNGAPGIDKVTLAAVEEYGIGQLLAQNAVISSLKSRAW
jgi:hypothetical protein